MSQGGKPGFREWAIPNPGYSRLPGKADPRKRRSLGMPSPDRVPRNSQNPFQTQPPTHQTGENPIFPKEFVDLEAVLNPRIPLLSWFHPSLCIPGRMEPQGSRCCLHPTPKMAKESSLGAWNFLGRAPGRPRTIPKPRGTKTLRDFFFFLCPPNNLGAQQRDQPLPSATPG